jgi:hypothetical protein
MSQMTWRAPESLLRQVRAASAHQGMSMNEWLTRLAATAVAEDEHDPPGARMRARLRAAGLLAQVSRPVPDEPAAGALDAARCRAGAGVPLAAQIVSEGRGERG